MKTRILIIDNYDSFTYNIVEALHRLGIDPDVVRNDCLDFGAIGAYGKIIISPGPGIPSEAGQLPEFLRRFAEKKPILGICLGHQALGEYFGARLTNLDNVYHGISSPIDIVAGDYMFDGVENGAQVGRYHSWAVDKAGFPDCLEVTALSPDGCIMAMRHRSLDIRGLQFHPESIMTPSGLQMLRNWINH